MAGLMDLLLGGAGVANQVMGAQAKGDQMRRDREQEQAEHADLLRQQQDQRSLQSLLMQSQIGENNARADELRRPKTEKPIAQGHLVDPVTGEVKFFDPTNPPQGLKVNPMPKNPVETPAQRRLAEMQSFKDRRDYEVTHPMPQQDNAKMTEFSNKAALVYPRAAEAAKLLDPVYQKGLPAHSLLSKVPVIGNYALSPEEQSATQAAETISSAILRLESGAAISEHEVKEYAKQFLPQPGDNPGTLAQKRATLQTQLERMRQAANPTMRRDTAGPEAPPAVDPLLAKYGITPKGGH